MNPRNIIITSAVSLLLIGGGTYWYLSKKATPPAAPTTTFPAGSRSFSGATGKTNTPPPSSGSLVYAPGSGAPIPRLYELHKDPVAGVGLYETGKGTTLSIAARYIERGLGNIFETNLSALAETRISNETHPRLSEAFWGNSGKSVIIRSLDDAQDGLIKSHILNLGPATVTLNKIGTSTQSTQNSFVKTEEIFLPDYLSFAVTAGDSSDKLFYLADDIDSVTGFLSGSKNVNASKIFNSPFTEWLPQLPNQNLVTLTTKPSAEVPGHLFFVNPNTKSVTKILGNIKGLTTLTSPNGQLVLYSESQGGSPSLFVFDSVKKQTKSLSLQTLPEKCAWSRINKTLVYCAVPQSMLGGNLPDQWYQGIVSFTDDLWSIDTTTTVTSKILSPDNLGISGVDMTNLSVASNDSYLVFINKISGTPWMYRLVETAPALPSALSGAVGKATIIPSSITPDMQKIR